MSSCHIQDGANTEGISSEEQDACSAKNATESARCGISHPSEVKQARGRYAILNQYFAGFQGEVWGVARLLR